MTKEELINQLVHAKDNYIMGLAAHSMFDSGQAQPLLKTHATVFGPYFITFNQVAELLENSKDHRIALDEFLKMLMRTLIKESFEHIKDYCETTNQYSAFKAEPWYEFARLIRNFLSHNCRFEFNKYDRDRLPVSWKALTITAEMDGRGLERNQWGHIETWELFLEFEDFVSNRLK
jgi:hypothetical protein